MKKLDKKEILIISLVTTFIAVTIVLACLFAFDVFGLKKRNTYTCREVEGGVEITGFSGSTDVLNIPSKIGGKQVVGIAENAFSGNKKLANVQSVKLPETLVYIGNGAFFELKYLTAVVVPKNVETIGDDAFMNCTSLANFSFENNSKISSIGSRAFLNAPFVSKLPFNHGYYMLDDIAVLAQGLFAESALVIPANIRVLAKDCFSGNANITTISVKEGSMLQHISNGAFLAMSSVESIDLGNATQLQSVGDFAFASCPKLESVTIPSSVAWVGSRAFENSLNVKSVDFGAFPVDFGFDLFDPALVSLDLSLSCGSTNTARAFSNLNLRSLNLFVAAGTMNQEFADTFAKYATSVEITDLRANILPNCLENFGKLTKLKLSATALDTFDHSIAIGGKNFSVEIEGVGTFKEILQPCTELLKNAMVISLRDLDYVENGAFAGIANVNQVVCTNVKDIGLGVFEGTHWIDSKRTGSSTIMIGNTLIFARSTTTLVVPDGVKRIDSHSIDAKCVVFPASVEVVASNVFVLGDRRVANQNGLKVELLFGAADDGTCHIERILSEAFAGVDVVDASICNASGTKLASSLIFSEIEFVGKDAIEPYSECLTGKNGVFGGTILLGNRNGDISSIVVQNGVRVVAEDAFSSCTAQNGLSLALGSSLVFVGSGAFCVKGNIVLVDIGSKNCKFDKGAFDADVNTQIFVRANLAKIYDLEAIFELDLDENEIYVSQNDYNEYVGALPNVKTY